jgi:HK97 family phage prohead protease
MDFILSNEQVNSKGYKIMTSGLNIDEFKANPVMLFDHDSKLVIGKWENLRIENDQLLGVPTFDEDDEFSLQIKSKVEKGLINGASIGIIIKQYEIVDDIVYVLKSNIYEISLTAIPANVGARKIFYMDKEVELDDLKLNLENINKEKNIIDMNNLEQEFNTKISLKDQEIELKNGEINDLKSRLESLELSMNNLLTLKDNEIMELSLKVDDFIKKEKTNKINEMVKNALNDNKITNDQVELYIKLGENEYESTLEILNSLKPLVSEPLNKLIEDNKGTINSADKWTFSQWVKNNPKGLMDMKEEDPDTYWKLYKELENKVGGVKFNIRNRG